MSPVVVYTLLGLLVAFSLWFAYHLRKDAKANPLDLITAPDSGRLSAAKIGQLVGIIVSSWVVIASASAGTLSYELFLIYVTYVGGVDLAGKYFRSKDKPRRKGEIE